MNVEQARYFMIEQQIRPCDVSDSKILALLAHTRRDQFVPQDSQKLAYADIHIPLGYGAAMWTPTLEAQVLQALQLKRNDQVLEVGTGSGYLTSLMAALAGHVTSVEIEPDLSRTAGERLAAHQINNVTLAVGDAAQGWREDQKFDVIVLTASTPLLPDNFRNSLTIGGRLLAIVGEGPIMKMTRITRVAENVFESEDIMDTYEIAPLRNAKVPERFVF
ncbi:MAG: protein-L-isoaspartate O-methyltransferase [Gallionella sp.]|nr:protein-L-isoaspartate O-methyltransferase [Gallionella sp.]